jgi:hypothetical protein
MVRATGTAGCASCGSVAGHLAHEVPGAWLLATMPCGASRICACMGAWQMRER